jgi:pilus assembly protein CpaE
MASSASQTSRAANVFVVGAEAIRDVRGLLSLRADVHVIGSDSDGVQLPALNGSVDVVLLAASRADAVADELATIREQTTAPIVVALTHPAVDLLNEVVALDPADVLVLPQPPEIIAFAIRKAADAGPADGVARHAGKVITVFSPKGGSGKSVVATNLGVALARQGLRTVLIDLDLQFGDAALMLSLDRHTSLFDLVSSPGELDAEKLRGFLLDHRTGLSVLAAPPRPQDGDRIDDKRIASLIDVAKGMFDAVVIDTAPLFDVSMLTALDRSDELLLVSGHDLPSVKNVRLGLDTLDLLSFPRDRITIVGNRQGMRGGIDTAALEEVLGQRPRFLLPDDEAVSACVNRGAPVFTIDERAPFSRAIRAMAGALVTAPTKAAGSKFSVFGGRRR